jgi:uncharacterized membrane protein YfcA
VSFTLASLNIEAILPYVGIGFAAQLVDGALGMAFGVISSTLLVSAMGVPRRGPARASIWWNSSPPARRD